MASEQRNSGGSTQRTRKATWTPQIHKFFVDLCYEQTLQGNKPGTHFNKEGWKNIQESFLKESGMWYERMQLKNHWDNTKEQWKIWFKLIGDSRMQWDPNTGKFGAIEEDWAKYIETNPEASPFRNKQLPFTDKLDIIFYGTAVTGETERPTKRVTPPRGCATRETEPPSQRRKHNDCPVVSKSITKCLNDAVESRSTVTVQSSLVKLNYSIGECIECLDGMEEVAQGSDLYLFALDIFLKKEYRETFLNLKKPHVRVAWLQCLQSVGPPLPLH